MPRIVVEEMKASRMVDPEGETLCLEMVPLGSSLEIPPPQKRKKSKVKWNYREKENQLKELYLFLLKTPEEEAKIKAKKQMKLDIQVKHCSNSNNCQLNQDMIPLKSSDQRRTKNKDSSILFFDPSSFSHNISF